jgi:hypothetical protein
MKIAIKKVVWLRKGIFPPIYDEKRLHDFYGNIAAAVI